MAINMETLKTRSLTALVFVLVMLGGLLWNQWSFRVLFILIHFGCWYEFVKILRKTYSFTEHMRQLSCDHLSLSVRPKKY